jgi:HK97 family phage major capsid protein
VETIYQQRDRALKSADDIVRGAKDAGRALTSAEAAEVQGHIDTAAKLRGDIEHGDHVKGLLAQLAGTADDDAPEAKNFVAAAGKKFAADALTAMTKRAGVHGMKALIGGTIDIPAPIADIVPMPHAPNNVIQLLGSMKPIFTDGGDGEFGANKFTYLRQTTRTNNATAVADGGTKPVSTYTWSEVDDRVRVYAHLSENLPERYSTDYSALLNLLQNEMARGIVDALENDVLNGPVQGAGVERFTGILNTSGVQTQAAVTGDLLATLSNAYLKLTSQGDVPTGWVMNPADYQTLTLLRENGATGALLFGSGRSTLQQIIGDAPIVTSGKIAAGTALVGDFGQARMVSRQNASLAIDRSGDLFETNQIRFRLEGRWGFAVLRPVSFVKITLPASS